MTELRLHQYLERQRAECSWPARVGDVVWVREDSKDLVFDFSGSFKLLGPYRVVQVQRSANPVDHWLLIGHPETGKIVGVAPSWWLRKDEFLSAVSHAKEIQDR